MTDAFIENLKAITELTPSSSEEDAKNTYDAWASTYEEVSWLICYIDLHLRSSKQQSRVHY